MKSFSFLLLFFMANSVLAVTHNYTATTKFELQQTLALIKESCNLVNEVNEVIDTEFVEREMTKTSVYFYYTKNGKIEKNKLFRLNTTSNCDIYILSSAKMKLTHPDIYNDHKNDKRIAHIIFYTPSKDEGGVILDSDNGINYSVNEATNLITNQQSSGGILSSIKSHPYISSAIFGGACLITAGIVYYCFSGSNRDGSGSCSGSYSSVGGVGMAGGLLTSSLVKGCGVALLPIATNTIRRNIQEWNMDKKYSLITAVTGIADVYFNHNISAITGLIQDASKPFLSDLRMRQLDFVINGVNAISQFRGDKSALRSADLMISLLSMIPYIQRNEGFSHLISSYKEFRMLDKGESLEALQHFFDSHSAIYYLKLNRKVSDDKKIEMYEQVSVGYLFNMITSGMKVKDVIDEQIELEKTRQLEQKKALEQEAVVKPIPEIEEVKSTPELTPKKQEPYHISEEGKLFKQTIEEANQLKVLIADKEKQINELSHKMTSGGEADSNEIQKKMESLKISLNSDRDELIKKIESIKVVVEDQSLIHQGMNDNIERQELDRELNKIDREISSVDDELNQDDQLLIEYPLFGDFSDPLSLTDYAKSFYTPNEQQQINNDIKELERVYRANKELSRHSREKVTYRRQVGGHKDKYMNDEIKAESKRTVENQEIELKIKNLEIRKTQIRIELRAQKETLMTKKKELMQEKEIKQQGFDLNKEKFFSDAENDRSLDGTIYHTGERVREYSVLMSEINQLNNKVKANEQKMKRNNENINHQRSLTGRGPNDLVVRMQQKAHVLMLENNKLNESLKKKNEIQQVLADDLNNRLLFLDNLYISEMSNNDTLKEAISKAADIKDMLKGNKGTHLKNATVLTVGVEHGQTLVAPNSLPVAKCFRHATGIANTSSEILNKYYNKENLSREDFISLVHNTIGLGSDVVELLSLAVDNSVLAQIGTKLSYCDIVFEINNLRSLMNTYDMNRSDHRAEIIHQTAMITAKIASTLGPQMAVRITLDVIVASNNSPEFTDFNKSVIRYIVEEFTNNANPYVERTDSNLNSYLEMNAFSE